MAILRVEDWRSKHWHSSHGWYICRRIPCHYVPVCEEFAELNHRLLHPRLHLRNLLQQPRAIVLGRMLCLSYFHLDLRFHAGLDPERDPRARPTLHPPTLALCHNRQCLHLDMLRDPQA